MTSPESNDLRKRLARLIAKRAASTEGSAVAAAARRTQNDLSATLVPLISEAGFEALSARAFDLARREYPADERRRDNNSPAGEPFGQVTLWLERQPSSANEAAAAMFATFAELLTALIGDPLTTRYLQKAWPDAFSDGRPKGKKA